MKSAYDLNEVARLRVGSITPGPSHLRTLASALEALREEVEALRKALADLEGRLSNPNYRG